MKKKKLLVIFKEKNDIDKPIRVNVKKAFLDLKKEGTDVSFGSFDELEMFLSTDKFKVFFGHGQELKNFDLIYFRSINCDNEGIFHCIMGLYPNLPLVQKVKTGIRVNKLYQHCRFARKKLPFPKTYFSNVPNLETKIENIEGFIKYPIVVKNISGAHGNNVFLTKNRQELIKIIKLNKKLGLKIIFQEFIPNDWDMRLVVLGDKVKFVVKRQRIDKNEWRNNTSLGAKREIIDLNKVSKEWKKLAVKATKTVNYTIGGVDIVQNRNDKKLYLLEVNLSPQFKPGTTEAIISYIKDKLK